MLLVYVWVYAADLPCDSRSFSPAHWSLASLYVGKHEKYLKENRELWFLGSHSRSCVKYLITETSRNISLLTVLFCLSLNSENICCCWKINLQWREVDSLSCHFLAKIYSLFTIILSVFFLCFICTSERKSWESGKQRFFNLHLVSSASEENYRVKITKIN